MTIIFLRLVSVGIGLLHNFFLHLVCAKKAENANMPLLSLNPALKAGPRFPSSAALTVHTGMKTKGGKSLSFPHCAKCL
jgi:hypothetical protein